MSAGLSDLKHKIAELEAKQQVTQAPSKPNPTAFPHYGACSRTQGL